jgi:hypothetical protein
MKSVIAAIVAVAAGLLVANTLGIASAEAPTGTSATSPRTVSVQGVATLPLEQGASAATATGVYRQAMAGAVADGQSKAEFLASKVGATLGSIQTVAEGGGSIACKDGESDYLAYEGEQPDFGRSESSPIFAGRAVAPAAKPAVKAQARRSRHRRRKPHAKSAAATGTTCALSTQVSLAYAIG